MENIPLKAASSNNRNRPEIQGIHGITSKDQIFYISMLQMLLEKQPTEDVLSQIALREGLSLAVIDMSGKVLFASSPFYLQDPL